MQANPTALRSASATLHTGHLESSNVNPVRGMVDLVEVSHDYQASQKLMSEFRKLDRAVMGIVR
jgi:flagellar basal body rod protein FlgG